MNPTTATEFAGSRGLSSARRIFLRDLEVRMFMGIHDYERGKRQRVIICADIYLAPPLRPIDDRIEEVVDYDSLKAQIIELAEGDHYNLQETFCERVLAVCLAKPGVIAALVSSEKPDVYADCAGVGFEIFAVKEA